MFRRDCTQKKRQFHPVLRHDWNPPAEHAICRAKVPNPRTPGDQEDTDALQQEKSSLSDRFNHIKSSLLAEAALDTTGAFAARLRVLFGDKN